MIVGTAANTKTWHLPKDLLVNSSPFFAAALNGSFAEARSKVVNFPEDDIEAFALFIQWLYIGEIAVDDCPADDCPSDHGDDDNHFCSAATTLTFVEAWILGDKLGCPIFKDLAMFGLIRALDRWLINTNAVRTAYERSAQGSKLRKILLDQVCYDAWGHVLVDGAGEWMSLARDCVDFGQDLMRTIFGKDKNRAKDPMGQKALYLEVLTDENACV